MFKKLGNTFVLTSTGDLLNVNKKRKQSAMAGNVNNNKKTAVDIKL